MRYDAVIFDFDYTLADATEGIVQSVNYAMNRLGLPDADVESVRATVGMTLPDTFERLTGRKDGGEAAAFSLYFREKADEVMTGSTLMFPDTETVLWALRRDGCKIAIVTSKFHFRIEQALDKYTLTDAVDFIVGFEDVKEPKPAPEGLLLAMRQIKAIRTLYVGDSEIDAQTAMRAGVDFAAVTTGPTPPDAFSAYPSVAVVENLSALYAALMEELPA